MALRAFAGYVLFGEPSFVPPKNDDSETISWTWDANPLVLVSRLRRDFFVPNDVWLREPTEADLVKWYTRPMKFEDVGKKVDRAEKAVTFCAGVTFLGTLTSAWMNKDIPSAADAPKDTKGRMVGPVFDKAIFLYPETNNRQVFDLNQFRDSATRALIPQRVNEAWIRVVKHIMSRDAEVAKAGGYSGLFESHLGRPPEMILLPLQDLLKHSSDVGQAAYGHTLASIPHTRNGTHLGGLHDYAVHYATSWPIVEAARKRISAWKVNEAA